MFALPFVMIAGLILVMPFVLACYFAFIRGMVREYGPDLKARLPSFRVIHRLVLFSK